MMNSKEKDDPKKRKSTSSEIAQHEPAQKKKPPDISLASVPTPEQNQGQESIPAKPTVYCYAGMTPLGCLEPRIGVAPPSLDNIVAAYLRNVLLETLNKVIDDWKEPITYQGLMYEHDNILGEV